MSEPVKIAIVDDDLGIREALEGLIASLGYGALVFPSAEAFLAEPARSDISCIVLDMRMQGMSGLELQALLNSEGNRTPIIFMTSYGDDRTREKALAGGALCFLGKPVSDDVLIDCIEKALTEKRTQSR